MLPQVLIVDDQYARDSAEKQVFLRKTNLIESPPRQGATPPKDDLAPLGFATFCSGQRQGEGLVENDFEVVRQSVAEGMIEPGRWALVLLDVRFDSGALSSSGPEGQLGDDRFGELVRDRLVREWPGLPIVMLSSKPQSELENQHTPYLSKQGLCDRELRIALLRHGRLSHDQRRELLCIGADIIAASDATLSVLCDAYIYAGGDTPVLILGESGVGKEIVARYIHKISNRAEGPFHAVNVASLPGELVEAELFGVMRGAATGTTSRPGAFEVASGGTLFLDEVGDLHLDAQPKLLRALQERKIRRIGATREASVDTRLISATSRPLTEMVHQKCFREELYYRIAGTELQVPPLRERPEEIIVLTEGFLERFSRQYEKHGISFSEDAKKQLQGWVFPGNVRELENLIERIVLATGNNRVIQANQVTEALRGRTRIPGRLMPPSADGERALPSAETTPPIVTASDERGMVGEDQPAAASAIALKNLEEILRTIPIDSNDPALEGAKPRLEEAFQCLLQRLGGAALELFRDPVSGRLNRQRAMQHVMGDAQLKGQGPGRIANELLGRRQEKKVEEDDLETLVRLWKQTQNR